MIKEFVDKFMSSKDKLKARFAKKHPKNYKEIVKAVVEILHDEDDYNSPDPGRITQIDHGEYQGTLLYVIASGDYQPSDYWYVMVWYGSCSGCDTLQDIQDNYPNYSEIPTEKQIDDYMTLALHIVQRLKKMDND